MYKCTCNPKVIKTLSATTVQDYTNNQNKYDETACYDTKQENM